MAKQTVSSRKKMRKTMRRTKSSRHSCIVRMFIEMLNVVKLYHWKTHSFPEHKATDELYARLNEHIDKFVEVLLGKEESRIKRWERKMNIVQYTNKSDFKSRIYEYREFLIGLNKHFDPKRDTDLLNIRDEILGDLNQFLYLLTFK